MTNILKKQNNLNNSFLIKSRKVISILVIFFLVITIMDSVTSSSIIKSEYSNKVILEDSENQINNNLSIEKKTDTIELTPTRDPKTFRRYTLSDALKRYLRYRGLFI